MEPNNNVLVVDALNVAFRWKHKGSLDFQHDYVRTVQSLASSYECSNVIIAADKGSSKMRKDLSPSYKGDRAEKYKDQTEKDKEDMKLFFEEYERTLKLLSEKYCILRYDQVEADDLAAYIVKQRSKLGIEDIWLISSDRDWDLLINDNVSRFSTVTRKETTVINWAEFFDFPIDSYISYKVLMGDKGDSIDGIEGIGPKRASDLVKQWDSAFDIYDALPLNSHYKFIQNLNASGDKILENYKMMDLLAYCEEAIECPGHRLSEIDDKVKEMMNDY